jgi:SAM-dependent methyltransferase
MRLFKHDGYDHYREAQIRVNKKKLDLRSGYSWASEEEVAFLSNYIQKNVPNVKKGLCHGIRNGKEIEWFKNNLGIDIIGTDISPTVKSFGGVIWDFHDINPEWTNSFDFVYSNSLDHAYDPEKAIRAWLDSISPRGIVIVQWTGNGSVLKCNEADCFSASLDEYKKLLKKCGRLHEVIKSEILVEGYTVHWLILKKWAKHFV